MNLSWLLLSLFVAQAQAEDCFLVREKEKIVTSDGNCSKAFTPQSTFKIPLALMGFDSGLLKNQTTPVFHYKDEYKSGLNVCKTDHNPKTWIRDSCVWFSRELTEKLGVKKFGEYANRFEYGNKNVEGDPGKENGLTNAWLNSSLKITPVEQIEFLQRILDGKLKTSKRAAEETKKILFLQELPGGWKLYGKTGNGTYREKFQQGWFTGWIEKSDRRFVFASHIADEEVVKSFASFRAKNSALLKLWDVIEEAEGRNGAASGEKSTGTF